MRNKSRRKRIDSFRQTRFVSAGRVPCDHAFPHRFVDDAECLWEQCFSIPRFSARDGGAQLLQLRFEPVPVDLIDEPPPLALSIPFDC